MKKHSDNKKSSKSWLDYLNRGLDLAADLAPIAIEILQNINKNGDRKPRSSFGEIINTVTLGGKDRKEAKRIENYNSATLATEIFRFTKKSCTYKKEIQNHIDHINEGKKTITNNLLPQLRDKLEKFNQTVANANLESDFEGISILELVGFENIFDQIGIVFKPIMSHDTLSLTDSQNRLEEARMKRSEIDVEIKKCERTISLYEGVDNICEVLDNILDKTISLYKALIPALDEALEYKQTHQVRRFKDLPMDVLTPILNVINVKGYLRKLADMKFSSSRSMKAINRYKKELTGIYNDINNTENEVNAKIDSDWHETRFS